MLATDVRAALAAVASPDKAVALQRFFKTGPGQYGEGDRFLGVTVPQQRVIAKRFRALPLGEVVSLLASPWHEHRLMALLLLVERYRRGSPAEQQAVFDAYLANTHRVNNWDLVDSSAPYIVGPHIARNPRPLVRKLIASESLWERRIGVLATYPLIRGGHAETTLWAAERLLEDPHDLMHKAVGWMLREVGVRVDERLLTEFLDDHAATMPRTMLRYALERLAPRVRAQYMGARESRVTRKARPVE
jgi:3-methyladenine DNA glycosylase AlkD